MNLSLKNGVRVFGLTTPTLLAVMVAKEAYSELGFDLVITAGIDGKHVSGSSHYEGNAIDLRTRAIPADKQAELLARIQERLGDDYFAQIEADHIHIQFKPKQAYGAQNGSV
jgi:hypothetical protein